MSLFVEWLIKKKTGPGLSGEHSQDHKPPAHPAGPLQRRRNPGSSGGLDDTINPKDSESWNPRLRRTHKVLVRSVNGTLGRKNLCRSSRVLTWWSRTVTMTRASLIVTTRSRKSWRSSTCHIGRGFTWRPPKGFRSNHCVEICSRHRSNWPCIIIKF